MKRKKHLYERLCSLGNLITAWRNARENKTQRPNIVEFEKDLEKNLLTLHYELKNKTYKPRPLVTFILRDPKTRKISKSAFRDRVVHHALINIIGSFFEKGFIHDSCANRIGKGTTFALKRFDYFKRKATKNNTRPCYVLKADIEHYFVEVNHLVLLQILERKIADRDVMWLIKQILTNTASVGGGQTTLKKKGMPLGNYTSQFFANVYLNELDKFVKGVLKIPYYIRYVDDFVIFSDSKEQLVIWKEQINVFLKTKLKIKLHPQKSRVISLSSGVDFVGFRNFYYFKLLRKRNIKGIYRKISLFEKNETNFTTLMESYQGWQAYALWADSHKLRKKVKMRIIDVIWEKIDSG